MKVVILTNILAPYRIPLFEEIGLRVDDLTIVLMADRHENREWILPNHKLKTVTLPGFHFRPPTHQVSLHVNYGVFKTLRRLQPDIVLSGGFAPANILAFLYCKIFKKLFIGWGEIDLRDGSSASLIRTALRRCITSYSNGAIASSSEASQAFLRYGVKHNRILLSLMPIDVKFFRQETLKFKHGSEHAALYKQFGRPILLVVGRITKVKGFEELFGIYQRLIQLRTAVSLLIVGDGPDRLTYEERVQALNLKNVHFAGFIQMEELPQFLALADVFVFPTLYDPFGAVLSEAMAAGVPVVSSIYAAATRDLVEDGVTGFCIDPKDTESSAATILKVLNMSEEKRAELTQAAYQRVLESDIEPTAESMVKFMRSLLNAPGPHKQDVRDCGRENSGTADE